MTFPICLKELREDRGLSQSAFAREMGVAQSTVGGWEAGKREPSLDTVQRIAAFFQVSVDDLLGGQAAGGSARGKKIPVLGYVRAGIPLDAIEQIVDYEEIPLSLARQGNFFALQIKGNSMEPRICEGDIVIVRQQTDVESGDVAIVLINDSDATVKKVVKHKNGISLVAYNPAYEPLFFDAEEILSLPVQVMGKVVELRGKL